MTLLYFAILVCVVYSSDDIDKGKSKKHVKPENKNCLNPLVLTPDFKNPFPVNAQEKKEVEEKEKKKYTVLNKNFEKNYEYKSSTNKKEKAPKYVKKLNEIKENKHIDPLFLTPEFKYSSSSDEKEKEQKPQNITIIHEDGIKPQEMVNFQSEELIKEKGKQQNISIDVLAFTEDLKNSFQVQNKKEVEEEKYEYLNKRLEFDDETIDNHKNDEKHCNVESKIILNPKRNCDLCFCWEKRTDASKNEVITMRKK